MKTALLPLEHLDFLVDAKNRKFIPNPEHGDKQMSEEYREDARIIERAKKAHGKQPRIPWAQAKQAIGQM